jgi:large subunit ribosomal protein L13
MISRGREIEKDAAAALMRVIKGMLPHNTLGAQMLKKLRVYAGPEHPHQAQKPS